MKGVAIEVPDSTAKAPSLTGMVERMLPPGAATAGLKYIIGRPIRRETGNESTVRVFQVECTTDLGEVKRDGHLGDELVHKLDAQGTMSVEFDLCINIHVRICRHQRK